MKKSLLSILIITSAFANLSAQSLAKELIDFCINSDAKTLIKNLETLEKREDISIDGLVYHIDYEIINDFHAQLFNITNTTTNQTYRLRIIKKDNQLVYYEIDKGTNNQKEIWIRQSLIITNCGTSLYAELNTKYESIYGIKIDPTLIFNTDFLYYVPIKGYAFNCPFHEKRTILTKAVDNTDTTQLLNWLNSGNVPLQLYAIEGIFQLTEKGVSFPPKTWNWIQFIQKKEGKVRMATGCGSKQVSIEALVQQIKAKYRKAKRKVKRKKSA